MNTDLLIALVCEYIGQDCENYLIFLEKYEEYEYLYTEYIDTYPNKKRVRYLLLYHNVETLFEYTNLISLKFSDRFNKSLKDDIPNSVQQLTFGRDFNQLLKKGDMPNSVKKLTFGWDFNQSLKKGTIPNSVKILVLPTNYKHKDKIIVSKHTTIIYKN